MKKHIHILYELSKDERNKAFSRQLIEVILLYLVSRLGPGFYILSRMYRKDVAIRDVTGYTSFDNYKKKVFALNDPLYHKCSQNKALEKAILGTYKIPTPNLLGWYHPVFGRDVAGNRLRNAYDIRQLVENLSVGDRFCFKLVESWGGTGFIGCQYNGNGKVLNLNEGIEENSLDFATKRVSGGKEGLIIEEMVSQHSEYSKFNSSSVNTLRIIVMNSGENHFHSVLAYLRVGRAGSLIDNAGAGGFVFPIDLSTGKLDLGFQYHDPTMLYEEHPDSGCKIAGLVTPLFNEAVDLAQESVRLFPGINFAGVDVGFSEDGPVILELNIWPDYVGFAFSATPSKKALYNPSIPK